MIGLDGPCGEHGGGIKLSSEHSQQQSFEYFRNNLRGRIQGKNNDLRLLFHELLKLEYLAAYVVIFQAIAICKYLFCVIKLQCCTTTSTECSLN